MWSVFNDPFCRTECKRFVDLMTGLFLPLHFYGALVVLSSDIIGGLSIALNLDESRACFVDARQWLAYSVASKIGLEIKPML